MIALLSTHAELFIFTAACAAAFAIQGFWLRKARSARVPWPVWALAATLLVVTWQLAGQAGNRERQRIQRLTQDFARLYGSEMEMRGHARLGSDAGPDDPLYLNLIKTEKSWLGLSPSVNDIYTLRKLPDGRNAFIVDSETDYDRNGKYEGEREQRTPVGEVYEEADASLEQAFRGEGAFAFEPITDRWGTWVSAFVPLRAPDGRVEAVLGVDFEARVFTQVIADAEWRVIGLMAVVQLVLLGASTLTSLMRAEARERQHSQTVLRASEQRYIHLIQSLPTALYTCDAEGRVTLFNKAAAALWGREPELGKDRWCGAWRSYEPNGTPVALDDCPMAVTVREGKPVRGREIVIERPDGTRAHVLPYPDLLRDAAGAVIGAIYMLVDLTDRRRAEERLDEANREMQTLSRQAGMAEVASSVLHNVGNVLNSVNVSVSVATDKVRGLKVATLERLAATLRGQQDLAAFLTSDPRGAELPAFLASVAERLGADRAAVLAELDALRAHIEHVNEIVAMQQSYANACGVTEVLPLAGLIEDALRMNAGSIERHGLHIVRDYAELPPVPVDRHKVLQILVNLIRNAKYALDDGAPADKRLTLRLGLNGGGRAKITISDNGVGIPAENLARIFGHGFTTRKGGHGFGLHSGANAARELGGFLTAQSDGPGRGATFTLELPIAADPPGGEESPPYNPPAGGEESPPYNPPTGGEESPPYNPPAAHVGRPGETGGVGRPGEARVVGRPFLAAGGNRPPTTHPGGEESPPYNTPTPTP